MYFTCFFFSGYFRPLLTLTESDLRQPPLQISTLGDVKRLGIAIRKLQLENRCFVEELCISHSQPSSSQYVLIVNSYRAFTLTEMAYI